MTASLCSPEVRIRIKHSQTAKGWRCDETTVEVTYTPLPSSGHNDIHQLIQAELYAAHQDGLEEAIRRNAQEGRIG